MMFLWFSYNFSKETKTKSPRNTLDKQVLYWFQSVAPQVLTVGPCSQYGRMFDDRSRVHAINGKRIGNLFVLVCLCVRVLFFLGGSDFNYFKMANLGFRMDCNTSLDILGTAQKSNKNRSNIDLFTPFFMQKYFNTYKKSMKASLGHFILHISTSQKSKVVNISETTGHQTFENRF